MRPLHGIDPRIRAALSVEVFAAMDRQHPGWSEGYQIQHPSRLDYALSAFPDEYERAFGASLFQWWHGPDLPLLKVKRRAWPERDYVHDMMIALPNKHLLLPVVAALIEQVEARCGRADDPMTQVLSWLRGLALRLAESRVVANAFAPEERTVENEIARAVATMPIDDDERSILAMISAAGRTIRAIARGMPGVQKYLLTVYDLASDVEGVDSYAPLREYLRHLIEDPLRTQAVTAMERYREHSMVRWDL
jgi:hypothetical protein